MFTYIAEILWQREQQLFIDHRYSRRHVVRFDGGVQIAASSSPHVVRVPMSDPAAVDPEEMFVASLSSCHMLWFLDIAARQKFVVERYSDTAAGVMEKNAAGRMAMTVVTLRPQVSFCGPQAPTREQLEAMHHEAHEACFIANSVRTEVRCEPEWVQAPAKPA